MQNFHPQPHIAAAPGPTTPGVSAAMDSDFKTGKKRGSYNCGRCGLPKKGHNCQVESPMPTSTSAATPSDSSVSTFSAISAAPSSFSAARQPYSHLRRALSFDDFDDHTGGFPLDEQTDEDGEHPSPELEQVLDPSGLPVSLVWEVLKRLPPAGLLSAANVCKGWRDTARKLWRAAEELRLRVPARAQVGFVASMLQKCPGLVRLSLRMERCEVLFIHWALSDLQF